MGFTTFLKQVGRIAFGYVGGFVLLLAGGLAIAQQQNVIGAVLFLIGVVVMLYGVFSERELRTA